MRCALHHTYIFFNEFKDLGAYEQLIQKQLPIPKTLLKPLILMTTGSVTEAVDHTGNEVLPAA